MNAETQPKPTRRSQAERSDAMRRRLLEATLETLTEDGYVGSTLSAIVRRAGVSRGAQVHHYPNKQALMNDAAEYLLRKTYRELGEVLLAVANEDDRLQALVDAVWERIFSTPLFRAYNELLVASQRDQELAQSLHALLTRFNEIFEPATSHYFQSVPNSAITPMALFGQLSALCIGFATHKHILDNPKLVDYQLQLWAQQAALCMQPRKGVHTPPPRPSRWD